MIGATTSGGVPPNANAMRCYTYQHKKNIVYSEPGTATVDKTKGTEYETTNLYIITQLAEQ
jgi:hypothetical protein